LYVVATILTLSRFGATITGLTMGTVAFLMGDGRYGIFEILKHITPGLLCDALLPIFFRGGRRPGAFLLPILGGVIGAGRFATIFAITLAVQPPKAAFAMLLPGLTVHVIFGVVSGFVCLPMAVAALALRDAEPFYDGAASGPKPRAPAEPNDI